MTKADKKRKKEFKRLLTQFSAVLLNKLMANERKYKFGDGWKFPNWERQLQDDLQRHIQKGDPRDTAIFSLFAWHHGWPTAPQRKQRPIPPVPENAMTAQQIIDRLTAEGITIEQFELENNRPDWVGELKLIDHNHYGETYETLEHENSTYFLPLHGLYMRVDGTKECDGKWDYWGLREVRPERVTELLYL